MSWTKLTKEVPPATAWFRWDSSQPGQSVEGKLVATRVGRFGVFLILEQEDNSLLNVGIKGWAAGLEKKMQELVAEIPLETYIKIIYLGPVSGRRGRPRLCFDAWVQEPEQ